MLDKQQFTYTIIYSPQEAGDYDLGFALTHYNIYPWIREENTLVRVLRTESSDSIVLAVVERHQPGTGITGKVLSQTKLRDGDLQWIHRRLAHCLGLGANYEAMESAARTDSVLRVALEINKGIRPKRYSTIFEATCGAICAQNVSFGRLYQMMELLSRGLAPHTRWGGKDYHAFPNQHEVAAACEQDLRECKVGYRAKHILKAAEWFVNNPGKLTQSELDQMPRDEAIAEVCAVPGIGPYSAAIVLGAGVGRQDVFQLDSFTRHILAEMYFDGQDVSDIELRKFVESRWAGFEGSVAHVLTTNTHEWAERLGRPGFRRSGAVSDTS